MGHRLDFETMGRYTVQIVIILLLFVAPFPALAQAPTPEMPYEFTPVDYEGETTTGINLVDIISSIGFINAMGSYAVTVWAMLDDYAGGGGVLGYLVIFLLGLVMIRWVASFVYNKPIKGPEADFSQAVSSVEKLDPDGVGKTISSFRNKTRF